jgi:HSP20 family protein
MPLIPWRKKTVAEQPKELSPLEAFRSELNRWLEDFEREFFGGWSWPATWGTWAPPVDVSENDKEVIIQAEVPGLQAEDLELSVSGNQLTLSGEKRESSERRSGSVFQAECRYGRFYRVIDLPCPVDSERVQAELNNGVLTVRLPKLKESPGRRIAIKAR